MWKALLLLLIGLPPLAALTFLPSYLPSIREELDWRAHRDPYAFLDRWPAGAHRWQALAELDAAQRGEGFVTRLLGESHYGPRYLRGAEIWRAQWSPDGTQILSGSATTSVRWDARTGKPVVTHGAPRPRDVVDANKWGFGFLEAAWYDGGRSVVAMTSGPHSLWFFESAAREPKLLDGEGYEALTAFERRVAVVRNLEYGLVMNLSDGTQRRLPHAEINIIGLDGDDDALTASRTHMIWWRADQAVRRVPIKASYNPVGFSTDLRWALVLGVDGVELWSSADGTLQALPHEKGVTAVCADPSKVAVGTDDGVVHVWDADGRAPQRRMRASTYGIDLLACTPGKLLSVSYNNSDSRVWDLEGRSAPAPAVDVPEPHLHWVTRAGADLDLPNRLPGLTQWMDEGAINGLNPYAAGAMALLTGVALWVARAERRAKD